jgi:nicotinate-nucleotide adenylyltransferase
MSDSGPERIGVYGGTFDPVHVAHVVVAVEVRFALGLDRVFLVVAGDPWQKRGRVVATAFDRLALVQAAVGDVDGVEASRVEIDRDRPSVTADTLEELAAADRELFLVLGADAVANMGTWKRLDDTRHLATLVIVERAGDARAAAPGEGWRVARVKVPRLDVSSTDVRDRLQRGRPVDGLVPKEALAVIRARGLYTGAR